jgi:hypothetical protein
VKSRPPPWPENAAEARKTRAKTPGITEGGGKGDQLKYIANYSVTAPPSAPCEMGASQVNGMCPRQANRITYCKE